MLIVWAACMPVYVAKQLQSATAEAVVSLRTKLRPANSLLVWHLVIVYQFR